MVIVMSSIFKEAGLEFNVKQEVERKEIRELAQSIFEESVNLLHTVTLNQSISIIQEKLNTLGNVVDQSIERLADDTTTTTTTKERFKPQI